MHYLDKQNQYDWKSLVTMASLKKFSSKKIYTTGDNL